MVVDPAATLAGRVGTDTAVIQGQRSLLVVDGTSIFLGRVAGNGGVEQRERCFLFHLRPSALVPFAFPLSFLVLPVVKAASISIAPAV